VSLFDFTVFMMAIDKLSASETTFFKSIITGVFIETSKGNVASTTGETLSEKTIIAGNQ